MPLQHINDTMLRRMQRRAYGADTEEMLAKLRARFRAWCCGRRSSPVFRAKRRSSSRSWSISSSEQRFERLGVFTYSFEPDTPAARLPDHCDEEIKEARRDRADGRAARDCLRVERGPSGPQDRRADRSAACPGEKNAWIGRTYADAPDVDSVVYVTGRSCGPGGSSLRNRGRAGSMI